MALSMTEYIRVAVQEYKQFLESRVKYSTNSAKMDLFEVKNKEET